MAEDDKAGSSGGQSGSAALKVAAGAGGCGCLALPVATVLGVVVLIIFGGLGVLLLPLIILILLFGGGGHHPSAPSADDFDRATKVIQGNGKDALSPDSVPGYLLTPIRDAGGRCSAIGPVVIAAQIEVASDFDPKLVGAGGAEGISQLPPAVFQQYGSDADNNGKVSALDPEDSIAAQGKYVCFLAGQVQDLENAHQVTGSVLDLTLAAYDVGLDAVKQAQGVPPSGDAQSYVYNVRFWFPEYAGVYPPLPSASTGPSPSGSPSASGSDAPYTPPPPRPSVSAR